MCGEMVGSMTYEALARPLTVGAVTLRNRVAMGSMHTGLEGAQDAAAFERLARFYAARARGGTALIMTGGFGPNAAGRLTHERGTLETTEQAALHRAIPRAVHAEGGKIVLQIVHAGRYGYHGDVVAPSPIRSPINKHVPVELTEAAIEATIADYVRCARLAQDAGYDGVEVMGSEGYLISQFLALRTNHRTDAWGGPLDQRVRFPVEVVKRIRAALGREALIVYRHSVLDLVEGGLAWDETVWVANAVARAGADILNTGIGWHEAKVPTIAGVVPHAAFTGHIRRLKQAVTIPVVASNRINTPEIADRLIADGSADLISMARPLLADPAFARKAFEGRATEINTCIACNQACLDHYFEGKAISCLVNPRAGLTFDTVPAVVARKTRVAVVGAGMAGLAAAIEAAKRGHDVVVFEAAPQIGGQMTLAAAIPGKADYAEIVRGYGAQLAALGVPVKTGTRVTARDLAGAAFDAYVVATGVKPRGLDIAGADDPRVVSYEAALTGAAAIGERVVVIGAGGIGHDVALFLAHGEGDAHAGLTAAEAFARRWGVSGEPQLPAARRQVTLLKRSPGPFGRTLGKSTGWILRQELRDLGVQQFAGVTYLGIDAAGLHVMIENAPRTIAADTIVVCAGQVSERGLVDELRVAGKTVHVIGGARLAGELDAKRAVEEGTAIGCTI